METDEDGKTYKVVHVPQDAGSNGAVLWKVATGVLFLVCIALAVALGVVVAGDVKPCGAGMAAVTVVEGPPGVFDDLTAAEIKAARDYLLGVTPLGIKPIGEATFYDNYIYVVEVHLPPKAEALSYLDNNGPRPERQALVTVYGGGRTQPVVEQYVVGPLPNPTRHTAHTPAGRKNPIPWHSRNPGGIERSLMNEAMSQATRQMDDILAESFDGFRHNDCGDLCLLPLDSVPRGFRSGERMSWHRFHRAVEGFHLHPLPCAVELNHTDMDHTRWRVVQVEYNNQYFSSVADFVQRYNDGSVEKVRVPAPTGDAALYSSSRRHGSPAHPSEPLRGPELIEPDGRRYKVTGRHIEYMGWSFDWRLATTSGPHLFDVRMNGERILYELAMKEIATWYSGSDPVMTSKFVDGGLPVGGNFELARGIYCPTTATFFDTVHMMDKAGPVLYKNSVCVFELNTGIPLRRHYESNYYDGHSFYGGLVDNALVLRTIQTVGNYDLLYDFIFHLNGVLEVKATLNGYVRVTYYHPNQGPYGYPAWGGSMANLHQHFFNYKVDLDVGGTINRFETVDITVDNVTLPFRPDVRHFLTRLERSQKTRETEATVQYDFTKPKYYNFYSDNHKNRFDVHRGYRIQLNGISKNLLPKDGAAAVNGAAWMDYQVAVTRRKDSESSSSSIFNQNDLYDPVVNFQSFIDDNENIVDEDLVAWVTLAAHHVPHSEDFPTTATAGNQLQFFIRPFHFYDEDPSIASPNAVWVGRSPGSSENYVDRYGTPEVSTCEPKHIPMNYDGRWHYA
ncbi:diamine oxidase [copper-containing]-like [Branchiostoma floridae x Branchiostoma belcheri]